MNLNFRFVFACAAIGQPTQGQQKEKSNLILVNIDQDRAILGKISKLRERPIYLTHCSIMETLYAH